MTENEFFFLQNSKWSKIKMKHDERYNRFSKPEKWFIDKRIYIYISSNNSVLCKLQGLLSSTTKGIKRRFG